MKDLILSLIVAAVVSKMTIQENNQTGLFWINFGCCFNDSVIIRHDTKVYFNRLVKSEEIVGTNLDNSFTILMPEKKTSSQLEVTYKGRKLKVKLDSKSNKRFIQFYFYQDSLYFLQSERGFRDE